MTVIMSPIRLREEPIHETRPAVAAKKNSLLIIFKLEKAQY